MKRKITAVIVLLCIVTAFLLPEGTAAVSVYFSARNNNILPLKNSTMPTYIDGTLYLPYSFFSADLDVFVILGDDTVFIYSSSLKFLRFDTATSTVFDQKKQQYYFYSAKRHNGVTYVPANFVCEFFNLTISVVPAEPAPIVWVRTASIKTNEDTFRSIGLIKTQLQTEYNAYTGIPTPNTTTPNPSSSPTPSDIVPPNYKNVTVYLSFFDLSGGKLTSILDNLEVTSTKGCFFVSAEEIQVNADLLRRAAEEGHTIGIWLKDGTYQEYLDVSAHLFEATKVKTVIVTSGGDNAKAAEAMAETKGLLFWKATRTYHASAKFTAATVTDKLSTISWTRESLYFDCSDKTAAMLHTLLAHLSQYKYSVRRINETTTPVGASK